jgi:transposase-like protein
MSKPRYSAEFKAYLLQEIAKREKPIATIAKEAKVGRRTLYHWEAAYLAEGMEGLDRRPGRPRSGEGPIGPAEEMRKLRAKIGELQMVIDFLVEACKRVGAPTQPSRGRGGKPSTKS